MQRLFHHSGVIHKVECLPEINEGEGKRRFVEVTVMMHEVKEANKPVGDVGRVHVAKVLVGDLIKESVQSKMKS